MFNNAMSIALPCSSRLFVDEENDLKKLSQYLIIRNDYIENVVGFLNSYFKTESEKTISYYVLVFTNSFFYNIKDCEVAGEDIKHLKMRWSQLYSQKHLSWCRHADIIAVRYSTFADILKKERPYFMRSPQIKYGIFFELYIIQLS